MLMVPSDVAYMKVICVRKCAPKRRPCALRDANRAICVAMCAHLPVRRALRNANARKPRLIVDSPSRLRHFHRPSRPNQPVISHQPDQRWAYTLSTGTFGERQRRGGHGRVGRHRAAGVHADVHLAGCGVSDWFRGVAGVASQIHDAAGRAGDGRRVFRPWTMARSIC